MQVLISIGMFCSTRNFSIWYIIQWTYTHSFEALYNTIFLWLMEMTNHVVFLMTSKNGLSTRLGVVGIRLRGGGCRFRSSWRFRSCGGSWLFLGPLWEAMNSSFFLRASCSASGFPQLFSGRKGFLGVLTLAPHQKVVLVTRLQISLGVEVGCSHCPKVVWPEGCGMASDSW